MTSNSAVNSLFSFIRRGVLDSKKDVDNRANFPKICINYINLTFIDNINDFCINSNDEKLLKHSSENNEFGLKQKKFNFQEAFLANA